MENSWIIKIVISVLFVLLVIFGVSFTVKNKEIKRYKNKPLKIMEGFTYTAHTGCMNSRDNSLESIEVGVENGAHIIEFDVQYYNKIPVLSHDEPKGNEISLKEAFLKVKEYENLKVNVDIKSTEYISQVQIIAEETGVLDRIFFTGIRESDVEIVKSACPKVKYYLNVEVLPPKKHTEEYLLSLVEKIKSCGAVGINFNKNNATEQLVDVFHKNGLLVSIWTVSEEKDIYRMLSYGPDNITTRRPDRLKDALKEINYRK